MDLFHRIALEEYILAMQENKHGDSAYVKDMVFTRFEAEKKMIKKEVTIGDCRLILGDCMEVMPLLGRVDSIVCDPPYGINLAGGFSGAGGFSKPIERRQYKGDWDNATPEQSVFDIILKISMYQIIWGGNYFTDKLPQGSFWIVWDKENTMPTFSDCELAWTSLPKKSVKKIKYRQNGCMSREKGRYHPTQKPVDVMRWCIEQLPQETVTILDPFMGSGTTLVACAKMGRKGVGIELDEGYFEIACKRVQEAYNSPDMLIQLEKQPAIQEKLI